MEGPIGVDLEDAEQCKAIDMIRFLFAFCLSEDSKEVLVRHDESLDQAFEEAKGIANNGTLKRELSAL